MPDRNGPAPLLRVELSFTLVQLCSLAGAALLFGVVLATVLARYAGREAAVGTLAAGILWVFVTMIILAVTLQVLRKRNRRAERLNVELLALHQAVLAVHREPDLDLRLQSITEEARQLLDARYGAISVLDENGAILSFITAGIPPEERERIGDPPRGRGLLAVPLHQGESLRITDIHRDSRAAGFPPGHPDMRTLLAVPIAGTGPFKGNLYLTEKADGRPFTADDESSLLRFATAAALAIDNAHLNRGRRLVAVAEERLRIAREMHDGLAQVLAYVNTKAQAVNEFLALGDVEEARQQLDQLAEAAREVATDAREGILSLRSAADTGQKLAKVLADYVERWGAMSGVSTVLEADDTVRLETDDELQIVRVVQEALANVRKHASANRATVKLARQGSELCVEIADDGIGFDPARPRVGERPRFGLATMRERAVGVGGTLEVLAAPGTGTTVRIRLPLPPTARA